MTVHGIYNRIRRPLRQLMGTTVSKTNGKSVLPAEGSIAVDDDDDAGGIRKHSLPQSMSAASSQRPSSRPSSGPRVRRDSDDDHDLCHDYSHDDVLQRDAYLQPKHRIDTALALDRCFGRASPLKGTPPPAPPLAGSLSSVESVDSPLTSPETSPGGSPATPEHAVRTALSPASAAVPKKSKLPLNSYIRRICMNGVRSRGKHFCMSVDEIRGVCQAVQPLLLDQPALLELATPVKVVGDIHGQFQDLLRIFQKCGMPPKTNYLFLGDYVDRGKQSLETIMLLLCLKLRYPGNVFLLRGNHESANVTKVYGFYDECKRRSSVKSWRSIVDVFNSLPIAATIGGKIFCVHGGLSPDLERLEQISKVQRPTDIPDSGLVSDLLWSDPDSQTKEWGDNDRGVSFCFGARVLEQFCKQFEFDLVARGHMVVQDGYEFFGRRRLVTVFSAPNYCGEFDNWGAVMSVDEDLLCSFELLEPK